MIFKPKVDCKPKSLALFIFTWILCFLCFATSAYGSDYSQSSLADLEKGLSSISDPSEKINQLLYLSEQYQDNAADKALDFANQALDLAQKNKLALKEIDSYNALGMAYLALKDLTQSKLQFDKALSLNTHQYTKGFSFTYLGNLEDALAYHIDALELAKDNSYNEGLRSALYNLSNDYAKNDDYKSAFDFYRLYATIKDQIFSKDYSDSISKMKTVYETEKKEQENALLKTSNLKSRARDSFICIFMKSPCPMPHPQNP